MSGREDTDIFEQRSSTTSIPTTATKQTAAAAIASSPVMTTTSTVIRSESQVVMARAIKPDGVIRQDADGYWVGAIRCPTAVIGLVAGKEQRNLKEIVNSNVGLKIEIARRRPEPKQTGSTSGSTGSNGQQAAAAAGGEKQSFTDWLEGSRCSNINVICSNKAGVEAGLKAVTEKVEAASRRAPFTHCICLPFLEQDNPKFVAQIEKFKQMVLSKASLDKEGIDSSVMISPKQIHFTLLMLMIYDQATLDKVIKLLGEFVDARKKRGVPRFPLKLNFTGIHIFDTDKPTSASVVFTHAGVKTTLEPAASAEDGSDSTLDASTCNVAQRALTTAGDKIKLILAAGNKLPDELRQQLQDIERSVGPASFSLREMAKTAPKLGGAESRRRPRDISTVSGPKVEDIFEMFCDLVQKLTDAGVLTDSDRRERRITTNTDGSLSKTSLTLHVTLMSAKWRSITATRQLQTRVDNKGLQQQPKSRRLSYRRGRNIRPPAVLMNVSDFLNETHDFGEAQITQLHLSRRANTGAEMLTVEKAFDLC